MRERVDAEVRPSSPEPLSVHAEAQSDAAALGLPALAGLLAGTQAGVAIVDSARRYVYANPIACEMLGHSIDQLRDRDFLDSFPTREHASMLARFAAHFDAKAANFTCVLLGSDAHEREVVCSTFTIYISGRPHGVVILWDLTGPRAAARTATALAQTAAQLVRAGTTSEILTSIARMAVENSNAVACGISVMDDQHLVAARGGFITNGPDFGSDGAGWIALTEGPVDTVIEAMTSGSIVIGEPPGRPVVSYNARSIWSTSPVMSGFGANLTGLDWDAVVCVPLAWQNRVFGMFSVFLPSTSTGPTEGELTLYTALADHAAVAVINARLSTQAAAAAALLERGRLARELHDSVTQGLFSMTMHARAAQLSMAAAGIDDGGPLGRSIAQVAELTRGALAEMRALIFELRPGALAEEGLMAAIVKHGDAIAAREGLVVSISGPDARLLLDPETEEHVYRIVSEALHNVVKHAHASRAIVTVETQGGALRVTVADDGVGFDADLPRPGHLGMNTMAQRALSVSAQLTVSSSAGAGTAVTLTVAHEPCPSAACEP
jgi:signal transduction histidine kinase